MKKFSFIAILGILFISYSNAKAETYVSGNIGVSQSNILQVRDYNERILGNDQFKAGTYFTGAVGARIHDGVRVEEEVGFQQKVFQGQTKENAKITSLLTNVYYDVNAQGVTPFVTVGVGVAEVNNSYSPNNNFPLAYQVGAGVSIPVSKCVNVDVTYRHFGTTEIADIGYKFTPTTDSVLLGLRVIL